MLEAGTTVVAASWGPFDAGRVWAGGVWFTFWAESFHHRERSDDPRVEHAARHLPPILIENEGAHAYSPDGADETGYVFGDSGDDDTNRWCRIIYCAFQLARSGHLAEIAEQTTQRHERKRTARAGLPARDVRVVRLRPALRQARDAAGGGREYRHRWVVRGHWRNAWLPSQRTHLDRAVPQGPGGAPLLGGERVTVL